MRRECSQRKREKERESKTSHSRYLQSTNRRRNLGGDHVHSALSNLSTVQLHESLLGEVETRTGSVNRNELDRRARDGVGQVPAGAAVGRVPDDVERAADGGEGRDVAERGEARRKSVRAVRARDVVHRASLIVVRRVEGGAESRRRRRRRRLWGLAARIGGRGRGCVGLGFCGWIRLLGGVVRGGVRSGGGGVGRLG